MHLINEGGTTFMIPLFILLIVTLFLVAKGIKNSTNKNLELIKATTLFALVFGLFGFILGLINALDMITDVTKVDTKIIGGGIKTGILPPTLGTFVFLIGRFGVIIITWLKKES